MTWYVIKLVYQIMTESGKPQFDVQLRLIRADELEWAIEKAHTMGRLGETMFSNQNLNQVRWKFVGVSDLIPLAGIEDGVQLYSETKVFKNATGFVEVVKNRAARILETSWVENIETDSVLS
jgi:hypothetical protein